MLYRLTNQGGRSETLLEVYYRSKPGSETKISSGEVQVPMLVSLNSSQNVVGRVYIHFKHGIDPKILSGEAQVPTHSSLNSGLCKDMQTEVEG